MSDSPYIPFYPSDWLAGTRGLTAAETGVYITLIAMMYEREAPLDMERKRLARLCGTTTQAFNAALDVLISEGKILDTDDGLWNKRAETECKKRAEKSYRASESANARWGKTKQKQQQPDADAMQSQCDGNANQNQNQIVKGEAKASPKKSHGTRLPDDWALPSAWGEWALSQGWPETVVRREAEKFRDYWHGVPGQKGRKADWLATWRNWMRNSSAPKALDGGDHAKPSRSEEQLRAFIAGARRTS